MATGSGKTVVMAMLIAWQALNKLANPGDKRFSDTFLVVTPGITIRDRLQVLRPNLAGNYYGERDLLTPDQSMRDRFPAPLVVHERRWWSSLLAPVYLQLLEGLRRVTEGQRGAGFCRECGQPFLTLDARRSSFCTDRERFRYSQRERRKRLSVTTLGRETNLIQDAG